MRTVLLSNTPYTACLSLQKIYELEEIAGCSVLELLEEVKQAADILSGKVRQDGNILRVFTASLAMQVIKSALVGGGMPLKEVNQLLPELERQEKAPLLWLFQTALTILTYAFHDTSGESSEKKSAEIPNP